jgi:hypothetical protein
MKKNNSTFKTRISMNLANVKFLILIAFLITSELSAFSQTNCGSLIVESNRDIRTCIGSSLTYTLFLKNNDLMTHEYTLGCINDMVSNPNGITAEPKAIFNAELLDSNLNVLNKKVVLTPGEQLKFFIKLTAPQNTPYESWNCSQVVAETKDCESFKLNLFSFYPNPNDHE